MYLIWKQLGNPGVVFILGDEGGGKGGGEGGGEIMKRRGRDNGEEGERGLCEVLCYRLTKMWSGKCFVYTYVFSECFCVFFIYDLCID